MSLVADMISVEHEYSGRRDLALIFFTWKDGVIEQTGSNLSWPQLQNSGVADSGQFAERDHLKPYFRRADCSAE